MKQSWILKNTHTLSSLRVQETAVLRTQPERRDGREHALRAAPRARPPPRRSRARTQSASGCIARALLGARGLANAAPAVNLVVPNRALSARAAACWPTKRSAVSSLDAPSFHASTGVRGRAWSSADGRSWLMRLLRLGGAAQVVQRIVGLVAVDVVDRLAIHGRVVGTERAPHDQVHSFTLHAGVVLAARGPRRVPEGPALTARGFGLHAPARRHARAPIALRVELPPLAWHAEARVWRAELLPRQVALVLGRWAMPELVAASGVLVPFSGLQTSLMLPSLIPSALPAAVALAYGVHSASSGLPTFRARTGLPVDCARCVPWLPFCSWASPSAGCPRGCWSDCGPCGRR